MKTIFKAIFLSALLFFGLDAADTTPQKVSIQLKWKHQFQFAGYYMAKAKGFYKDAGLDVEIKEYQSGTDIVEDVLQSKSTFGVAYPNIMLEKDADKNIMLLYALFQSSPHVLVSLKSSNIETIKDFQNKRIMISKIAINTASIISMLISKGVDFKTLTILEPTYNIQSLLDNKTDITTAYISNEIYKLDKMGIKYNIWNPKNYGFDLYDDILFTSQKELKEHPKVVELFTEASLKGFEYAFSHIDETVDIILKKYNTMHKSRDALIYEAKVLKKLAYQGVDKLGKIDKHKIQRIYDLYNLLGMTKYKIDLSKFIYTPTNLPILTNKEVKYLQNKKYITMCIDPNWMPFEKIENGKQIGLNADYFKIFENFLQTEIKLIPTKSWSESLRFAKERKCDILSLAMETKKRKAYLNFTKPYLKIPIVLATKPDKPFIADFSTLNNKTVAIPQGYAFAEILKLKYPKIDILEVKNIDDGLQKVIHDKAYGYIGTLASIGYSFQKKFTGELKIAGKFDGSWDLGIAVRNDDPMLFEVLQKAIGSVDEKTKQHILNNWLSIKYEKGVDYGLLWQVIAVFSIVLVVVLYFYIKLNKLKNEILQQKEEIALLALTDYMTKLYNRRYFTQISNHLLHLAKRSNKPLSILMLDIDDFKKINDTYGHKAGDDVIISLANTLKSISRESDVVCRFGGEEFIMLFPNTDIENSSKIATKIKNTVENLKVQSAKDTICFTVSIGLGKVLLQEDKTIEDGVKRADDALYMAKENGKNLVCIHEKREKICLQD